MRSFSLSWCVLLLMWSSSCGTVNTVAAPIDRQTVLRRALAVAPELQAARAVLAANDGREISAKKTPQPELEFEMEEWGLDRPGISAGELNLRWSRDIEPHRTRRLRILLSRRESAANTARQRVILTDYLYEVSVVYYTVLACQLEHALAKEQEELSRELCVVAQKRVNAGAAPGLEAERAAIELATAEIETARSEKACFASTSKLAAYLDWPVARLSELEVGLGTTTTLPSLATLKTEIDSHHPQLLSNKLDGQTRETALTLARAESRTVWRALAGIQHFRESKDNALVVGLAVPLGTGRRNRGAILEARAKEKEQHGRLAAERRRLERSLEQALLKTEQTRIELKSIEERIVPRAEEVFTAVKAGYLRGELTYTDMLDARRSLVSANRNRVAALIKHRSALLELEYARGGSSLLRGLIEEELQ